LELGTTACKNDNNNNNNNKNKNKNKNNKTNQNKRDSGNVCQHNDPYKINNAHWLKE